MAVFYRAIWCDTGQDVVDSALELFCSWVREKSDGALAAAENREEMEDGSMIFRREDARSEHEAAPVAHALRASLVQTLPNGSRWTTTLRAWSGPQVQAETGLAGSWLWVDVEAVSHDTLDGVVLAAPRFVVDLLELGDAPSRHEVPLAASATRYEGVEGAEALAGVLTDTNRDMPVVVFAPPPAWFDTRNIPSGRTVSDLHQEAINRAARMTAGLALVSHLDAVGAGALAEAIGESYSVRDGAFRIYLPSLDPAVPEEWRHRYTIMPRYIKSPSLAGGLINRAISLRAGARRAPDSYEAAAHLLESMRSAEPAELTELLEIVDDENLQLRERMASLDQSYLDLVDEQQLLEEENNLLREELHVSRRKLALVEPKLWDEKHASMARIQDEALSVDAELPSDAAAMAQDHLSDYLNFPLGACVDLLDIDTCVEARSWGSSSWRAFRALHAYAKVIAEGSDVGSFWVWCQNSRHPLAWSATSKKLAMKESDAVNDNDRLSAKRIFPVDKRVSPSGVIYMQAHIKIAEGGGSLAPRIYFLHSRATDQVHIGYFGPHRNVPNTLA